MALRDQPYLPLYIQDFMTDEKLIECSAESTGVYIRVMCLMHKSESYGQILLKQKYKQNEKQTLNFAKQLARTMPYDFDIIERSLDELVNEGVLILENGTLSQKRMIRDNYISEVRKTAGKKGGDKKKDFAIAKSEANTEYEYANENIPSLKDFIVYAKENQSDIDEQGVKHKYTAWKENGWKDGNDKPIKNWKTKLLNTLQYIGKVSPENQIPPQMANIKNYGK